MAGSLCGRARQHRPHAICGPNDINSRYLTEDVPFGLVPWAAIAEIVDVPMPLTNGFIDIINVVHEKDWRENGLTAE